MPESSSHSLMDVLGLPFEALFLGDYCLTTAGSLWACIVVLTAAVSFWRITAAGSRPHQRPTDANPSFHDQLRSNAESAETEVLREPPHTDLTPDKSEAAESGDFVGDDGGRKGAKFAAYYCEADDGDNPREEEEKDGRNGKDEAVGRACDGIFGGVWGFDAGAGMTNQLPLLPVVRTGDLGWYRCQDLTVLNGSVVRLWEGGRRRCHR